MTFKENGRLTPASKEEVASVKGKQYICQSCGNTIVLSNVQFAATQVCNICGRVMSDGGTEVSKLTGRIN